MRSLRKHSADVAGFRTPDAARNPLTPTNPKPAAKLEKPTAAEALRWFLANKPTWTDETWSDVRERCQTSMFENDEVKQLGLSGAQYGSAVNPAGHFYRKGPISVLKDEQVKDRHIQVSKNFP